MKYLSLMKMKKNNENIFIKYMKKANKAKKTSLTF